MEKVIWRADKISIEEAAVVSILVIQRGIKVHFVPYVNFLWDSSEECVVDSVSGADYENGTIRPRCPNLYTIEAFWKVVHEEKVKHIVFSLNHVEPHNGCLLHIQEREGRVLKCYRCAFIK